jgi:phospholipase C
MPTPRCIRSKRFESLFDKLQAGTVRGPIFALACLLTVACSSNETIAPLRTVPYSVPDRLAGRYIKHVIIIVQENRSFDNLFAGWPGADAPLTGVCYNAYGQEQTLNLVPGDWSAVPPGTDLPHSFVAALIDWDQGKMDGFCEPQIFPGQPAGALPYGYLKPDLIKPYRTMARDYVLADHMFPTEFGGSFQAHLNLIAGTTQLNRHTSVASDPNGRPWGCDAAPGTFIQVVNDDRVLRDGGFPCFTQFRTIADDLDANGISWKYYAPYLKGPGGGELWISYDAIAKVRCATFTRPVLQPDDCHGYGSDWKNIISPQTKVLTEIGAGALPSVAWVIPSYADSDHPGSGSATGPSWVTAIVNAIGKSQYWRSSAIVVLWDDWGGFYDNVPPPQLDYLGLGIRVPCLIISPYAKQNYVSHTQYEYGSILKFIEEVFHLPPMGPARLGYTDTRANSILDSFDFTKGPRRFHRIRAPYPASHFLAEPQSNVPPDSE